MKGLSASFNAPKNPHDLVFEDGVRDDDWAIQHLPLPLGSKCNGIDRVADIVEALVPEECFHTASASMVVEDSKILDQCRNEVLAENTRSWTCGAECGKGLYSGLALYPKRFFVNITSHYEWYLSRGVDINCCFLNVRSLYFKERKTEG